MKNRDLLVTSANAHHDFLVVVDVAGNGRSILQATGAEVREGQVVISCEAPARKPKAEPDAKLTHSNPPPTPAASAAQETAGSTVE